MIFPYLWVLIMYIITSMVEDSFAIVAITSIVMSFIYFIVFVATLICIVCKWDSRSVMLINLLMKIIYIPVHSVLLLLAGAMANPFLLVLMPIPFFMSVVFMAMTGTISVAANVNFYRNGNYKFSRAFVYSLLSYCYVADIVVAIITYINARKCNSLSK